MCSGQIGANGIDRVSHRGSLDCQGTGSRTVENTATRPSDLIAPASWSTIASVVPDRRHITDLRIALEGERRAAAQVRAARRHADALLDSALAAGIPYAKLARVALKMRLGRAPTAEERQREIDRLRQRRRRAMTGCHVNVAGVGLKTGRSSVGSTSEVKHMSERLIRRKTVEEEFITGEPDDEKDDDLDCADDKKAAAAGDEDDDEEEEEEGEDEEEDED